MDKYKQPSSLSTSSNFGHRKLHNLPDSILHHHLFKYLDLDCIWMLRLVSKKFNFIVKSFNITELSFLDFKSYNFEDNWFSTTRSTRLENQLDISKLSLLSNPPNNLINLKCLRIENRIHNCLSIGSAGLDFNKFTELRILETHWPYESYSNYHLHLPDLVALSIRFSSNGLKGGCLVINTPKLHSLSIYNNKNLVNDRVYFNHPYSIRHLRLSSYEKSTSIFTNLECLEVYFGDANALTVYDLLKFVHLKYLKLNFCYVKDQILNDLLDLCSFQLVLHGVKINEVDKIGECNRKLRLEFQLDNYSKLDDNLDFIRSISGNDLIRLIDNQPADLFTKYTNIQHIEIDKRIEDENRLADFIKGCPNLSRLEIVRSSFGQKFYDQLPTIKSLSHLKLMNQEPLKFKFLMKMPYLRNFQTNQDVKISKNKLSLNNFKRLARFQFIINNQCFDIKRKSKGRYLVNDCHSLCLPYHKYFVNNELVKWTKWLRKNKNNKRVTKMMSKERCFPVIDII